jgi:hypothetical protein
MLSHPAHPLVRLATSTESLEPLPAQTHVRASFPRLSSLIAASSRGVHWCRRPKPSPFRPRRFSRPRRLPPPRDFAGLFHPATTSRVRSSGVSPGEKPYGLVARRCPRVVARAPYSQFNPSAPGNSRPPTGPCSAHRSVAARSGLDRALLDPLLSFILPRVFLHTPSGQPSPPLPTAAFHGPRRVTSVQPDLLLRACLPRPKFPACSSVPTCADTLLRGRARGLKWPDGFTCPAPLPA